MRVLCAGDLHIGRRPSRLPRHVDARTLSCADAWTRIVEHALDARVDVVALSGDVVDRANRYFEALGPLERGVRRLAEAGVVTVAVAGNHDHDVLPQLARALAPTLPRGAFRLLGAGGAWERTTIDRGGARLHVDGWSFPAEHVGDDPLATYALPPADDAPVLGLLHADLDAAGRASRYAPVSLAALHARPVALWLLGHVHAPALHERAGCPPVLYPGCPQPMDPGEPGARGAWLVELRAGAPVRPRRVPLATVRYETVTVDAGGVADADTLRATTVEQVRAAVAERLDVRGPLRHLSLRVRVTGATPLHDRVERELRAMVDDLHGDDGGVQVHVERLVAATRPARDLDALAQGGDAPALLARLLRTLDDDAGAGPMTDAPMADPLLGDAARIAAALRDARPYAALPPDDELDAPALRAVVAAEAARLLEALLGQREARA